MTKKVLEASQAVAKAVQLCKPTAIPMYPITPQTHIVERLADYINDGELDSEMIHVESEHSALSACLGVSSMGERVFTATASQGLALMHEILFVASGMRFPIVMGIVNRALSAPINIWNDHQDSVSSRDAGWIQLYVESAQEALDTIIMAYKIAENKKVLMPAMVCLDGFTLSHVFEPVDIPSQANVNKFLPKFKPVYTLDPKKPITMGPIGYPDTFMKFRKQQHDAMINALQVIKQTNSEFKKKFKRGYGNGLIETYNLKESKIAIVALGTICGTIRFVINKLKKKKINIGLIKLKSLRPFPSGDIQKAAKNLKKLVVIDRNISPGSGGSVYNEIKASLNEQKITINSFVAGLGGKDVTKQDINKVINITLKNKKSVENWVL